MDPRLFQHAATELLSCQFRESEVSKVECLTIKHLFAKFVELDYRETQRGVEWPACRNFNTNSKRRAMNMSVFLGMRSNAFATMVGQ